MANFINKYTNIEAYNADEGKQYPNVSYLVTTDEIKWNKYNPDHIVCKLNVTSTSSATNLFNKDSGIKYQIIDGIKQDAVQTSYTFDTMGEHIVEYKLDGTSIVNNAFGQCSNLTNITIPDSVTNIGSFAFSSCSGLTSITIPNSVTSIGNQAFYNCSSLTSITIPNSVTNIGGYAFSSCSGLTSIVVDSANTVFDSRNNCNAIIKTSTNGLIAGCKNTIIPDTVTSIGISSFGGCKGLTNINIPDSVTSIGGSAFYYCSGLTSVTIPDSVTSIDQYAFDGCKGLTSVTIEATTPPTLGSGVFDNNASWKKNICPDESVEAYKTATNWSRYSTSIKPLSEYVAS